MKALITAGGRGTRLRPLTHTSNKHLIPIANKPMIHYAIDAVVAAGIWEIGIVINPETGEEIRQALGDGGRWGARFTYILQEAPLGLAHVVKVSQDFLAQDPFLFYLGDNLIVGGITRFIEQFERDRPNCLLVLAKVKDPQRFGVPEMRDGAILHVEEKPQHPKSPYAVTGIYLYNGGIMEAVQSIAPSARGELEISDAHQYLIEKGYQVAWMEITGWWKDTGKPEDLLEANRLALDSILDSSVPLIKGEVDQHSDVAGKVIIEEGATILRSEIRGPAIIGKGTVIEKSYIGPFTSISDDCEIRNSEVEHSILLERVRILDAQVRMEKSLLGREVVIIGGTSRPRTQKFIVGDQSRIELA